MIAMEVEDLVFAMLGFSLDLVQSKTLPFGSHALPLITMCHRILEMCLVFLIYRSSHHLPSVSAEILNLDF